MVSSLISVQSIWVKCSYQRSRAFDLFPVPYEQLVRIAEQPANEIKDDGQINPRDRRTASHIRVLEDDPDAHDDGLLSIVESESVHCVVSLGQELVLRSDELLGLEEEVGRAVVGDDVDDRSELSEERPRSLLYDEDDQEVTRSDREYLLEERRGVFPAHTEHLIQVRESRGSEPRHDEHVEEQVDEGELEQTGLVQRESVVLFEADCS